VYVRDVTGESSKLNERIRAWRRVKKVRQRQQNDMYVNVDDIGHMLMTVARKLNRFNFVTFLAAMDSSFEFPFRLPIKEMKTTYTPSVDMLIREEKEEDSRVAIAAKMIVFDKDGTHQVAINIQYFLCRP
jgi:hypothetical protein